MDGMTLNHSYRSGEVVKKRYWFQLIGGTGKDIFSRNQKRACGATTNHSRMIGNCVRPANNSAIFHYSSSLSADENSSHSTSCKGLLSDIHPDAAERAGLSCSRSEVAWPRG